MFAHFRNYSARTFTGDAIAGITVGLVALPLALAFGSASGVTPQAGLYTAIVGGLIAALFGGSSVQVSGPTGACVVVVAGIIAKHGVSGLLLVTVMAGVILLVLGLTGLGTAVRYIPRPIVIGFTNGIAVLIASIQIKEFFGLRVEHVPSSFLPRMRLFLSNFATANLTTIALGAGSLLVILVTPLIAKKLPGSVVALVIGTACASIFGLRVETIGSKFGGIPSGFPPMMIPDFRPELILSLVSPAFTIAILAALASLLSAVVADTMTGHRHNSNSELVGQGLANLVVPFFGGIPVSGAIARTTTNIRAGALTPMSAILHAITLLVLLAAAPLAKFIPLTVLAAVLFAVAYNMGEWREIGGILRLTWSDKTVWLITFLLTVIADLSVAVEVGLILAALLYIYRIAQTTTVSAVTPQYIEEGRNHILQDKDLPPYVRILRIHGPFLFGTTDKLLDATSDLSTFPPIIVLRLRNMTAIDATGLHALKLLADRLRKSGRSLILCGAREQPKAFLQRAEFIEHIGTDNIQADVRTALDRAKQLHEQLVKA